MNVQTFLFGLSIEAGNHLGQHTIDEISRRSFRDGVIGKVEFVRQGDAVGVEGDPVFVFNFIRTQMIEIRQEIKGQNFGYTTCGQGDVAHRALSVVNHDIGRGIGGGGFDGDVSAT